MTTQKAALLHDVVQAIVESGYAVPLQPEQPRRRNVSRIAQIEVISYDPRLFRQAMHTQTSLIDCVMYTYSVQRGNARKMISAARRLHRERKGE